jgi:putative tryptophan/tyrosine transport system substrate-binding protein
MRAARLFRPAEMPCSGRAPRHARHIGGRALARTRAAAAWPVTAHAQQPAMPVVGFLGATSPEPYASVIAAFRKGLNEAGFVDGQDVTIEYRWAEEQYDRMPALADDLVRHKVSVIAAVGGTPSVLAAKAATSAIPIVFVIGVDPVKLGLVQSLNRPGGNITGVTSLAIELGPKRLELLHEMVPAATVAAVLVNPTSPDLAETAARDVQSAARTLGLELHVLHASTERDFDHVFAMLAQLRAGVLVIGPDSLFVRRREQLGELTLRHAVPAIAPYPEFAAAGGLMSYGADFLSMYRQVGVYSGRILKGDKPSDLPVHQATKLDMTINLKTAKALGLDVPPTLLVRADEVIE